MTLDELKDSCVKSQKKLNELGSFLKIAEQRENLGELEEAMSAPDFWNNQEKAQAVVAKLSSIKSVLEPYTKLHDELSEFDVMIELVEEEPDMLDETVSMWKDISVRIDKIELMSYLSGQFDKNGAFISIQAGAGGTESCDWASMLYRMYRRFIERRGWKEEMIEYQAGDEAGIKGVTLKVSGDLVYGHLKSEMGIHRLVRISPFDSNAKRHTSFASVEVYPEINDDIDIELEDKDMRIDTFRSSGAGGQHVNTTDSAIRITHLPTGTVVSCQNDRSQHKNRATALNMLKARLYEIEQKKKRAEADAARGEQQDNSWGSQIRSYVLHPYQMVKDLRTGEETGNTSAVLDGDINSFVDAYLKKFGGK